MGAEEREELILFLSANPRAGDLMAGTGGARKVRFKRPGTGKSGGYRIIFYYAGEDVPLFLLNVFTKGDRANLSKAEQNILRGILSDMIKHILEGMTHEQAGQPYDPVRAGGTRGRGRRGGRWVRRSQAGGCQSPAHQA
jgi:hypothetical protein